jgi:hypothetical protein
MRYLNESLDVDWDEHIARFHGHTDSLTVHVTSFVKFMSVLDVIHDDAMMKMFVCTLENEALDWFENLRRGGISTFAGLIKAFCEHWDLSYGKEEKVEDLVEACQDKEGEI